MKTGKQFELPKRRSLSFIERVDTLNFWKLTGLGLLIYLGIVVTFSLIETAIGSAGHLNTKDPISFPNLIYFNFISILTIGYGDLAPKGIFRAFTIMEAILGLATYSLMISIVTVKLLLPKKNIIVFSKYAYYCEDHNAFMIIYLNTATQYITNLETSWYFKLNEDWQTRTPRKVPFITKSVQTFYLKFPKPLNEITPILHRYDCLRIGLSGNLGMANYSTFVEYGLEDILIIKNRSELTEYGGFYKVDAYLGKKEFEQFFHYKPPGARPMIDLIPPRGRASG